MALEGKSLRGGKTGRPRPTRADDDNDENDENEPADISGPTRPTRPGMEYAVRGDSTPLTLIMADQGSNMKK